MNVTLRCKVGIEELSESRSDGLSEQRLSEVLRSGLNDIRGQKTSLFSTPKVPVFERFSEKGCFFGF